jgi:hypothetical protein
MIANFIINLGNQLLNVLWEILPSSPFGFDINALSIWGTAIGTTLAQFNFIFPVELGLLFLIAILNLEVGLALFNVAKFIVRFFSHLIPFT